MTPFEKALVLHLVGDWLLQNEWMATNKAKLHHPASWVHAAIHGVLQGLVFGWFGGFALGAVHMLIDTRAPLRWWSRVFGQTQSGDLGVHVAVWGDQVVHVGTLALWVLIQPNLPL